MNSVSTQFGKRLVRGLMLAGAMLVAPIAVADDFRIESKQGSVESVDYSASKLVVGGVSYDIAPDANVELGGSYGAFTMITPGMNVSIIVQRFIESGHRQIIEVKELAPGVVPQQY
jgi:hypothetical protein